MDKPEDISADVWGNAEACWLELTSYPNVSRDKDTEIIARAILSTQSQAYIDAASIAGHYRANMSFWLGKDWQIASTSAEQSAQDISAAILQRKEEIGR